MGELINLSEYRAARDTEQKQETEEELTTLRHLLSEIITNLPEESATYYIPTDQIEGDPFILSQTNLDGYYTDDDNQ
tara:strand:+ start:676 stop:906 length:231 start_codon:yes stop_codon:yes gene_type:complete